MRQKIRKKQLNSLDKYLIYCIVFFTIYVISERIAASITGISCDSLTNAVKLFCGGEAFLCAMIKRHKLINARKAAENFREEQGGFEYDD